MKPIRIYYYSLIILAIVVVGCRKDNVNTPPPPLTGYKIVLKEGDKQTDIIGNMLKKDLVFKVSKNDSPSFNGYVFIETLDCDGGTDTAQYLIERRNLPADYELLISHRWKLNATVGEQTLKAILLDSMKTRRDSVIVTATGTQTGKGWYASGCIPDRNFPVTFCELPSGRILAGLYNPGYPYYSDDEGASWHALKTFSLNYRIKKLVSTPSNEVFLSTENQGMYYSSNGGQTWQIRNNGLPVSNFSGSFFYTKSGKLFASTIAGTYLSVDKGLNWHMVSNGIPFYASFYEACSLSDGTILAASTGRLISSIDGGENWREVYTLSSTANVSLVFADDNDNVYVGISTGIGMGYGIYKSDKTLQSWTKVFTVNPPPNFDFSLSQMSMQNGSFYFYSSGKNILTSTTNFSNYATIDPPTSDNNGRRSFRYIITKNNHVIVSTEFFGIYYYIP